MSRLHFIAHLRIGNPAIRRICRAASVVAGLLGVFAAWPASPSVSARADTLVTKHGGQVSGRWLNREAKNPEFFEFELPSAGRLTIPADDVREVRLARPSETQYEAVAPTFKDSVEDQWRLAEWCREHDLASQRRWHLRRVIELDPNQSRAWIALGYSQIRGQWKRPVDVATDEGYVWFDGRWRLPQEVELIHDRRRQERVHKEWTERLSRLRDLVGDRDRRSVLALQELAEIREPQAVPGLSRLLNDPRPPLRAAVIESLSRIATPDAIGVLCQASLVEPHGELFHRIVDELAKRDDRAVVGRFIEALSHADNACVNRAAFVLGRLNDPIAVSPLIDSLVTVHVQQRPRPANPDATRYAFAADGSASPNGGTGLQTPAPSSAIPVRIPNQEVLTALVKLSGGANYGFDQQAWKHWYAVIKAQGHSTEALNR